MFSKGQKITVTAKQAWKSGFVRDTGKFIALTCGDKWIKYETHYGQVAEIALDSCFVKAA